jgi:hypothetical protein
MSVKRDHRRKAIKRFRKNPQAKPGFTKAGGVWKEKKEEQA